MLNSVENELPPSEGDVPTDPSDEEPKPGPEPGPESEADDAESASELDEASAMDPPDAFPELQAPSSPAPPSAGEPPPPGESNPPVDGVQSVEMQPPGPAPSGPTYEERQMTIAFLIELVGGFFGLLGLGYLYAGRTSDGLVRLVVWLLVLPAIWTVVATLMSVLVGCCLVPVALIIQFAVPVWSAITLKGDLERQII